MMRWRKLGSGAAVAVLAVTGSGCAALGGGSDDGDAGSTPEVAEDAEPEQPDEPEGDAGTDEPQGDAGTDDAAGDEPEAGDLEVGDGDEGAGSDLEVGEADDVGSSGDGSDDAADGDAPGRATPADLDLDATVRHPGGTVLELSSVTFDGAEIRVEAELINGASGDVAIELTGGRRLRLVDDRGAEYNFVVPDDLRDRNLELAQGESVGGEFVFIGPIDREANSLTLAANTFEGNPQASDMESAWEGENRPVLVMGGIDLEW
jgi:hypothetical protein